MTASGRSEPTADEPDVRARRIIDVLMALDEGEVTTYGDIASVAGYPRNARLVGRILATTDIDVPWWRVVNAEGRLVASSPKLQAELLAAHRADGPTLIEIDETVQAGW